jgi:hypothetical protein
VLETPGYDDRRAQDVEILRYLLATTGCRDRRDARAVVPAARPCDLIAVAGNRC